MTIQYIDRPAPYSAPAFPSDPIASLFAAGEMGIWLDPSDLSTMFQESSSGATPVTADGQPVGLMLDKHAWGGKTFPALVASLADKIANGDNEAALMSGAYGAIGAFSGTVAQSADQAASGTKSAKFLANTAASVAHYVTFASVPAGRSILVTGKVYLPSGGMASLKIVDTSDGSLYSTITSTKDTWVPFSIIRPAKATAWPLAIGDPVPGSYNGSAFYLDDISIKEIPGNHVSQSATASRPVYKTDGTLRWLQFDGVDDYLVVNPLPLSPATALQWGVGAKYPGGSIREWFSNYASNTEAGIIDLYDTGGFINAFSKGNVGAQAGHAAQYPSTTNTPLVMVGTADIPGSRSTIRANGVAGTDGTAPKGTGTFADKLFTVGRRAGTSYPINGAIYGLFVRAGSLDRSQMYRAERWLAGKTGAAL